MIDIRKRIAYVMTIGLTTTGIITFILGVFNFGMVEGFILIWVKSWVVAYIVVVPVTLVSEPIIRKFIDGCFDFGKKFSQGCVLK